MTTYTLQCEEANWVRTRHESEEEEELIQEKDRNIVEIMDRADAYYWITKEGREDVLVVPDFIVGENILKDLEHGDLDSFEHAEDTNEAVEIRSQRPPL